MNVKEFKYNLARGDPGKPKSKPYGFDKCI